MWRKKQNEKELCRRTKKKLAIKAARTKQIQHNTTLHTSSEYNVKANHFEFHAPLCFSFLTNPEGTNKFFNSVISFITNKKNYGKRLYFDISQITELTIDTLMYLLAIVNNLVENFDKKFRFSGNEPKDPKIRKLFAESGFYQYVKYCGSEPLSQNTDTVQIATGRNCDITTAKKISDFISRITGLPVRKIYFIYIMMIELMSNTFKHAYTDNKVLYPQWYCFAEFNKTSEIASFTFMDTGAGIPATVRKNFSEKLDILRIKGEDKYVVSALKGDFRTGTQMVHRGKGLPKIRKFCSEELIMNMRILTNCADVSIHANSISSQSIHESLRGTLYYWQIDINKMKEELQ